MSLQKCFVGENVSFSKQLNSLTQYHEFSKDKIAEENLEISSKITPQSNTDEFQVSQNSNIEQCKDENIRFTNEVLIQKNVLSADKSELQSEPDVISVEFSSNKSTTESEPDVQSLSDSDNDESNDDINDKMSKESETDEDDDGTESLASVDTIEAEDAVVALGHKRKLESDEPLSHRIFGHVLLRGIPLPEGVLLDSNSSIALTTTRNTPPNVLEAIDRDLLSSSSPSITVEEMAQKYGCIKLVVTRRIAALMGNNRRITGIHFGSGSRSGVSVADFTASARGELTAEFEDGDGGVEGRKRGRGGGGSDLLDSSARRREIDDLIQRGTPAVTARELAETFNVSVPSIHARIYYLRTRGMQINGIRAAPKGRNRIFPPSASATPTTRSALETETKTEALENTQRGQIVESRIVISTESADADADADGGNGGDTVSAKARTDEGSGRLMRFFNSSEDDAILAAVEACAKNNAPIPWGDLDAKLQRNRGACKQRWLKGLEPKILKEFKNIRMEHQQRLRFAYADHIGLSGNTHNGGNISDKELDCVRVVVSAVIAAVCVVPPCNTSSKQWHFANTNTNKSKILSKEALRSTRVALGVSIPHPVHSVGEHTPKKVQTRNFTANDDALIVEAVYGNRNNSESKNFHMLRGALLAGKKRGVAFWAALDRSLGRPVGACKGRWNRVLMQQLLQTEISTAAAAAEATAITTTMGTGGETFSSSSTRAAAAASSTKVSLSSYDLLSVRLRNEYQTLFNTNIANMPATTSVEDEIETMLRNMVVAVDRAQTSMAQQDSAIVSL